MSWLWGTTTNPQYEELVEKACSQLNLPYPQSEDMATSLEVTDMIRSKAVQPKLAMQSLKRRVASKNGRVQMYALGLIDTCIKNGGDHFLFEIASKEFVDEMSTLIKSSTTSAEVKQMALRLFQSWALAFKPKTELSFFVDVYNELKNSGVAFPPPPTETSSHLLDTSTAPAWVDSDVCMRCRTAFTFTNRKHHCRNCGLVFDQACSSKTMPLPRYGITEDVRVCEGCWTKSGKGASQVPAGPPPAVPGRTPRSKRDLDADLQRAIELSLQDSQPASREFVGSEPPLRAGTVEDDDEQLRLAIEASLRDMDQARPSAPIGMDEPEFKPLPTFDLSGRETETILTFSNTMDQMAAYGERDLRRFPHAHVLADQAYALGGKLHRNAEEKHTKQQMLAEMQSKLSQAVSLYGTILDGQQAYAARKMQESQQRQYAQHQQQYQPSYASNPYTSPYTQSNGYASPYPSYAPPHAQSSQAASAAAGPSMYPSMPSFAPPNTDPYGYTAHVPQHQPWAYAPNHAQPYQYAPPQQQPPQQQWSAPHAYETRAAQNTSYSPAVSISEQTAASAPPPVDLASHPSSSPRSITAAMPSAPQRTASYASTSPIATAPVSSPPEPVQQAGTSWGSRATLPVQQQPQQQQQQQQQQWEAAHGYLPQLYPPQQEHAQPQAQPQAPPQNVYSAASFPAAPAAVFPDAPSVEPTGIEKREQDEPLLIEL